MILTATKDGCSFKWGTRWFRLLVRR